MGRKPRFLLPSAGLAALCVLALVGDDRHVGLNADGRQMIRTAVAIAETGEIGQARGRDFTVDRPGGDAVSRFGMATSFLQVPAAWLAPRVEAALGPGSSQALFLILPWLAIGVAAGAGGAIARRLGGGQPEVVAAVCLASIASPLGSYAFLEFSEPVQAAALALALAASLAAAEAHDPRRALEWFAGLAAGVAVLAKTSLLVTAPLMLLPMVDLRDRRRTARALVVAGAGAAIPLAVWTAFELQRFGQFFGGYPDDRFTHPWLDGFWRLLVGPNRGLLLFWPALLLALWAGARWKGQWLASPASRAWLGAVAALASQFVVVSGYWGWHGMEGWGPRLVLAPVAALAPFAAIALGRRRALLAGAVFFCAVINLPPLLQHPTPVATYVTNLRWPAVPEAETGRYPFYATAEADDGRTTVVPFAMVDRESSTNPWRVYLWLWNASRLDDRALARALAAPPWIGSRPDLVPAGEWPPSLARQAVPRPRWGFLGRSLTGTGGPYQTVYLDALLDQVVRAHQLNRTEAALELSRRRVALRADGEASAWRLESLRRAGRATEAESFLRSLPASTRVHPFINVVLALFDRDAGEEARARALLGSVAASLPGTPAQQALQQPLPDWPATLDAMTQAPRRDATVRGPR